MLRIDDATGARAPADDDPRDDDEEELRLVSDDHVWTCGRHGPQRAPWCMHCRAEAP